MADVDIRPVGADRWDDLSTLFGPNGAYSNCWCTWWLFSAAEFDRAAPADRRALLEDAVTKGREPGLLAYVGRVPVGWCAVGPRRWYARLNSPRSRTFRPIDDAATWVVNCFFVHREHRRQGIGAALLDAAVTFAGERGATVLEGYPVDETIKPPTTATLFVGSLAMFTEAGFREVSRVNDRPLVRLELSG